MPRVLLRFDGAVGLVELLLPQPEVLLFRQLSLAAQNFEDGRIGRRLIEKASVKLKQRAERRVVESELAVHVKDGNAGRELIKYAAVRLDHAREFSAHDLYIRAIDRDARTADCSRRINDFEHSTAASRNSGQPSRAGSRSA